MDDREKLIKLLKSNQEILNAAGVSATATLRLADHLLANGVAVRVQNEPLTNADRIRSMSDEELAKFINDSIACDHCIHDGHCNEFDNYQKCLEGVLKRLRQPVEGDLGR